MTNSPTIPRASASSGLNEKLLFWASFMTLIAAGIGFSVRGFILKDWGNQFGFTQSELGGISGGGLAGFGLAIIFFSFFADRFGYGKLMLVAFLLHLSSAVVTFAATAVYEQFGRTAAFNCLSVGMFLFALGNGTCEAVINPLTATLFPRNKTHWLNILHAGWPLGLILGAVIGLAFGQIDTPIRWEFKLGLFLVPVLLYGFLMFNRPFPRSEATSSGISTGGMLIALLSPILLFLFLLHALVGYVELGTDSWITNITDRVLHNETYALLAFIWTNALMFTLRFFAGPIVHRINPIGLLLASALFGTLGLFLLGQPGTNTIWLWVGAVTIYGIGKTFYWPTMLGVISERFPKGGALALGISGGIGMISAGLLGGPGIGYKQDLAGVQQLRETSQPTYERYASRYDEGDKKGQLKPEGFPIVTGLVPDLAPPVAGLDNAKLKVFDDYKKNVLQIHKAWVATSETIPALYTDGEDRKAEIEVMIGDKSEKVSVQFLSQMSYDQSVEKAKAENKPTPALLKTTLDGDFALLNKQKSAGTAVEQKLDENLNGLNTWWREQGMKNFSTDENVLDNSRVHGAKKALLWTAAVPAALALGYLILLVYFMSMGGYKQVHLEHGEPVENRRDYTT